MHTYKKNASNHVWVVGHYRMDGSEDCSSDATWLPLRAFDTELVAAAYVNFLNGGRGFPFQRHDEGKEP